MLVTLSSMIISEKDGGKRRRGIKRIDFIKLHMKWVLQILVKVLFFILYKKGVMKEKSSSWRWALSPERKLMNKRYFLREEQKFKKNENERTAQALRRKTEAAQIKPDMHPL